MRVIDAEGKQVGIMTKQEALERARQAELDLVEIAPNTDPPVARILDFEKFRYQENKKEQAARKGMGETELKELWLSPRIAEHDLMIRLNKAEEFLKEGNKVKLTVKFKGREMAHPEIGHKVLQKALNFFEGNTMVEREPKFEGRRLSVIISRARGVKNGQDENKKIT